MVGRKRIVKKKKENTIPKLLKPNQKSQEWREDLSFKFLFFFIKFYLYISLVTGVPHSNLFRPRGRKEEARPGDGEKECLSSEPICNMSTNNRSGGAGVGVGDECPQIHIVTVLPPPDLDQRTPSMNPEGFNTNRSSIHFPPK